MKKPLSLVILALVATLSSCDKEGGSATALEGKWEMVGSVQMTNMHPLDITFSGNTYIWHVGGVTPMKETGTFTFENDVITLNSNAWFTCSSTWKEDSTYGSVPVEDGNWVASSEKFGTHSYKVISLEAPLLTVKMTGDDMYSADNTKTVVFRQGNATQTLDAAALTGTYEVAVSWNLQNPDPWSVKYRISFSGENYTLWHMDFVAQTGSEGTPVFYLVTRKQTGKWTHEENKLTLTPEWMGHSYAITNLSPMEYTFHAVNEETMEVKDPNDWYIISGPLDPTEWTLIKLQNSLFAIINMDTFEFSKK